MFGVHSKNAEAKRELVITLGNDGSSASILEIASDKKISILFNAEQPFTVSEATDPERIRVKLIWSFKEVLHLLTKSGISVKTISKVTVVISSPWSISRNKTLSFADKKRFIIKQKMLDDLLEASKQDIESEVIHESMMSFEERTLAVSVNGYSTKVPIGKEGTSLEVSVLESYIARSVHEQFRIELEKMFPPENIFFTSSGLSVFRAFSTVKNTESDYLFVRVGDEVTEIGMVKEGMLRDTVSLPKGRNLIIRSMGDELHAEPEAVRSMLKLAEKKKLDAEVAGKIDRIRMEGGKKWSEEVSRAVGKMFDLISMPKDIFIISKEEDKAFFSEAAILDEYYGLKAQEIGLKDIEPMFVSNKKMSEMDFPHLLEIIGVVRT